MMAQFVSLSLSKRYPLWSVSQMEASATTPRIWLLSATVSVKSRLTGSSTSRMLDRNSTSSRSLLVDRLQVSMTPRWLKSTICLLVWFFKRTWLRTKTVKWSRKPKRLRLVLDSQRSCLSYLMRLSFVLSKCLRSVWATKKKVNKRCKSNQINWKKQPRRWVSLPSSTLTWNRIGFKITCSHLTRC